MDPNAMNPTDDALNADGVVMPEVEEGAEQATSEEAPVADAE